MTKSAAKLQKVSAFPVAGCLARPNSWISSFRKRELDSTGSHHATNQPHAATVTLDGPGYPVRNKPIKPVAAIVESATTYSYRS